MRKMIVKMTFIFIFIFTLDVVFMAAGAWSVNYGFSLRRFLFFSLCLLFLYLYIEKGVVKKNHFYYLLIMIFFLIVWVISVPTLYDGNLLSAFMDGQFFIGLLIIPFIGSFFFKFDLKNRYKKIFFCILIILAFIHLLLYAVAYLNIDYFYVLLETIKIILEPGVEFKDSSIYMGVIDERVRIFWGGSIFLLILFYLSFLNFIENKNIFFIAFAVAAIYTTATRSILISIVLFMVYYFIIKLIIFNSINSIKLLIFGIILMSQTLFTLVMADPEILNQFGLSRAISDDIRFEQAKVLTRMFLEHPFIGGGLGAHAIENRSNSAPWSYELSIFALYMKIGFLGIIVLLIGFLLLLRDATIFSDEKKWRFSALAALILSYNFCANTNPFIFSFTGIIFVSFFYIEYLMIRSK